ncbi:biofilm formation regulator HmsP [Sodalis sp. TME1]|nr:biofilm formation regulator HmsP [Sodalis sp. TME1]
MRIRRSLTIKQMATVSGVALVAICLFIVIQLFHFVSQRREDYTQQLQNIAMSVRQPLSSAVLKADIPQAEQILVTLKRGGILSRADVVLPNNVQVLHGDFPPERPVPALISRLFRLPVEVQVPLYSLPRPSHPQALAYLVLQADSYRLYQFIVSAIATMITTYLLLALIMTVAITWCINRLMVHPLRAIARELENLAPEDMASHQLTLPNMHRDDELGVLVRSYNRNQHVISRGRQDLEQRATPLAATGLPTRARFLAMLDAPLATHVETGSYCLLVIAVTTLPEATGVLTESQRDLLYTSLANRLRQDCGATRLLAQLNPHEFALCHWATEPPFQAMALARRVLSIINGPLTIGNLALRPAAGIGVAFGALEDKNAENVLNHAALAASSAAARGRNQILFFEPALAVAATRRLTFAHRLLEGIVQGRCALFFQPQVDMRDQRLLSAEALLRWRQDDGSWSLPEDFICQVEAAGVMVPLGNWVLEEACRVLGEWQGRGIAVPLAVNLSALQLQQNDLVSSLKQSLARFQVGCSQLVLEITETARINEFASSFQVLRELHDLGIVIALDDFGMGYSSLYCLDRLRHLPIDMVKIDRSFIATLPEDAIMLRVVSAIADVLDLPVIAEGVENAAQRDCLLAHHIHRGQGYLFAEPLTQQAFEQRFFNRPSS